MNNQDAVDLVEYVFKRIESAETTLNLKAIFDDPKAAKLESNKMDDESYPQIQFKITADELEKAAFLTDNHTFPKDLSKLPLDPLTKLLYAICWKNGDLKKVKHIVQGIKSNLDGVDDKEDGLVFYQFGKYLTKRAGEPIIDQHVLRAYAIYKSDKSDIQITKYRTKSTVTKKDVELISEYKIWLKTCIKEELRGVTDYSYYIDKTLFALGKTIKAKKKQ